MASDFHLLASEAFFDSALDIGPREADKDHT